MTISKKLNLALLISLIAVVSIAFGWQYLVISNQITKLTHDSAEQISRISRENEKSISTLSKSDSEYLKQFEIHAAEDIFQLINANLSKDIKMGNKRGLIVRMKGQKIGQIKEISVFDHRGVVRFSADQERLGRPINPDIMGTLVKSLKKVVRSDENGRVDIYEPQIVTRKCTMCHIHQEWRGKEGMVGGVTFASISTEEFNLLQQNNQQLLSELDDNNKKSVEDVKRKNMQNIIEIRNSFIWTAMAALGAILCLSFLTMQFSIGKFMVKPVRQFIEGVNKGAVLVATASKEVNLSSRQLSDGSTTQAAALEETSSSLEQVSVIIRRNADYAEEADQLMKNTGQVVTRANTVLEKLMAAMTEISKSSEAVSKIIRTIDEIAFKTNLLALNAAVEAARAGHAGVGFAVVADEVRNLATQASQAAQDTAKLIEATEGKISEGNKLVHSTNNAFDEVSQATAKMGDLVGKIASASAEQALGIEHVNKAVAEMNKIVQQNAAHAGDSAQASNAMSSQAEELKAFIESLSKIMGGASLNNGGTKRELLLPE